MAVPDMTAITRALGVVVGHRPMVAVGASLGAVIVLALVASSDPPSVQGLLVTPFAVMATLALFRRGFAGVDNAAWLTRTATAGMLVRLGFVVLHLVIGYGFYGGAVDFIGWRQIVADRVGALVRGEGFDLGMLPSAGGLGDLGIGNLASLALLTALAVVTGPSFVGMFPACAILGAAGAYLFLRAYQEVFPARAGGLFLPRALFFLPAIGFWSVYLGKDSLAFFFLAWATHALARLLVRRRLVDLVALATSLALLIGVRPHMGAAVGVGLALAIGFHPLERRGPAGFLRPLKRIALLALVAVAGGSSVMQGMLQVGIEAVTIEALAERAYVQQRGFVSTEAASGLAPTIQSGDPTEVAGAIPFGIFTLLFRPLPWEAHNVLAVVAAAENLLLLGLVIARWRSLVASLRAVAGQPFMLYVFVVLLVGATALSFNWNLGTLARHRTMVLPFLMILLSGPGTDPRRGASRSWPGPSPASTS